MQKTFSGVGTALLTPIIAPNGLIDFDAFDWLVEDQMRSGVSFGAPGGSTGSAFGISHEEQEALFKRSVRICSRFGKPVMAGAGSNRTETAVELTLRAKKSGAQAVLQIGPYMNKPEPGGFLAHYRAIHRKGMLPSFAYQIPGRTGRPIPTEVIIRLAKEGSIAGLKWSWDNDEALHTIMENVPSSFVLLSGDDNRTYKYMKYFGAKGLVSVCSHVCPEDMVALVDLLTKKQFNLAEDKHKKLTPIMEALFCETNPQGVTFAMNQLTNGFIGNYLRLPLVPVRKESEDIINSALQQCNVKNRV